MPNLKSSVIAFDPTDSVLCYSRSERVELLDIGRGFKPRLPLYVSDFVRAIKITPDGRHLFVASGQEIVVFQDFLTDLNPTSITYKSSEYGAIESFDFSTDRNRLFALTMSGNLYVWDLKQPDEPKVLKIDYDTRSSYGDLQIIMGGNYLLVHKGPVVEIRAADAWNSVVFRTSFEGNITSKAFSDKYRLLAISDQYGSINVWQFDERNPAYGPQLLYREYHGRRDYQHAVVAVHPHDPVVAIHSRDGLTMLDLSDPQKPVKSTPNSAVSDPNKFNRILSFSATGRYLVTQTADKMQVWSVPWYAPRIQALTSFDVSHTKGKVIATQSINVRSQPSQNARILGQLDPNQEVLIVGRNEDGSWLQIIYRENKAWVAAFLLQVEGDVTAIPQLMGDQTVQNTVRFTGTVRDLAANDAGVPSAFVIVGKYTTVGGITDTDGVFDLSSVPAGEQWVSVLALYHETPYGFLRYWFDPVKSETAKDILVLPKEYVKARIRLYKENTVTVLPYALVRLYRLDTMTSLGEFTTDANGMTQIVTLPAGPYLLEAIEPNNRYYSIIFLEPSSEETAPILSKVLQLFELPEMEDSATPGITVLAALEAARCSSATTLFAITAFDLDSARLLKQELSTNPRILLNFDTTDTSGRCVVRYDALCSTSWYIGFDVFECPPDSDRQLTVSRSLTSPKNMQ